MFTLPALLVMRRIDLVAALLILLATPLVALGWTAGAFTVALSWIRAAVLVGWDAARSSQPKSGD